MNNKKLLNIIGIYISTIVLIVLNIITLTSLAPQLLNAGDTLLYFVGLGLYVLLPVLDGLYILDFINNFERRFK